MLIKVQVVYRHGLIKDFLADGEMLLAEFSHRIATRGAVRSVRGFRVATEQDLFTHSFLIDENGTPTGRLTTQTPVIQGFPACTDEGSAIIKAFKGEA